MRKNQKKNRKKRDTNELIQSIHFLKENRFLRALQLRRDFEIKSPHKKVITKLDEKRCTTKIM